MSSWHDSRRRDRSWERDERSRDHGRDRYASRRRRDSRSRSPPRRGGDGPRPSDRRDERRDGRRDYGRDRDDDRRDRDRRGGSGRDYDRDRLDYGRERERDDRRDPGRRPPERESGGDRVRQMDAGSAQRTPEPSGSMGGKAPFDRLEGTSVQPSEDGEEGEAMDAVDDDDAAMMAMMGMSGFGTTKGKHVSGNQEGGVNIKKQRTWRQYMNRRGGFNRPLDKIK